MRNVRMAALLVVAAGVSVYVLHSQRSGYVERATDVMTAGAADRPVAVDDVRVDSEQVAAADGNSQVPTQIQAGATGVNEDRSGTVAHLHSAMERAMLSDGTVNERAIALLGAKNFDGLLTKLESEQLGVTSELTTAYRAELERSLSPIGQPKQIDRLVCGVNLCVASIRSPDKDWYESWFDVLQEQSKLPITTLTGKAIDLGASGMEYRLLFTTSSAVKGFSGSPPRR